jgi:hypothetical protein
MHTAKFYYGLHDAKTEINQYTHKRNIIQIVILLMV